MIVVTGAAGFIGSCLVAELDERGYHDLVMVDDFNRPEKKGNIADKSRFKQLDRADFHQWLEENHKLVYFVFHIGARTDTTEFDDAIFDALNVDYSKKVWTACTEYGIPLVYASSAATYGGGEFGYKDDHPGADRLQPLNPYGWSKQKFDLWALKQDRQPYFWAGLKFFNVYGPNEYHKGRMASVVFHAFNQAENHGEVKLFRSHHPDYSDGGQLRDFIYVKDVVDVCIYLMETRKSSGLYNLGTGKARTFLDLAHAVFSALGREPNVRFVDTPEDIRDMYQYFTQAEMGKLRSAGYTRNFHALEEGIRDYVDNYLIQKKHF